jgi:plastocyanin
MRAPLQVPALFCKGSLLHPEREMGNALFSRCLRIASILATLFVAFLAMTTLPADASDGVTATPMAEVIIIKMQFEPKKLVIKAGTTVKWINKEKRNNHSIFFEKEGLAESERLFQDETWQRTFEKPGVYPYICGPHPHMTGEVVVE